MSERKPPTKSWESWIEQQIGEAREAGAFDNLAGAGKPLPYESYDPLWWVKRLLRREQLSVLPPALELLRKVESVLPRILALETEAEVRAHVLKLNAEIARVNATVSLGPPTRVGPLDVEEIVAQWRARRQA